jgi:hypothetical protein
MAGSKKWWGLLPNVSSAAKDAEPPLAVIHVAWMAIVAALVAHGLSQSGGMGGAIGIGVLITIAGAAVGGLVGFLFSLPRVLSGDPSPVDATGEGKNGAPVSLSETRARKRARLLGSNTNLERISEWLTTMLVGVGLTQIPSLFTYAAKFSDFVRTNAAVFPGVNGQPASAGVLPMVAPLLLAFGVISGFLFFYLYTRLALSPLFLEVEDILAREVEQEAVEAQAEEGFRTAAASLADAWEDPVMRQVAAAPTISVGESLNVITSALYEEGGHDRAIALGYSLASTAATELARYWFLMAAAFGQRHHALLNRPDVPKSELAVARRSALNAVKEALKRDPRMKATLASMLEPDATDNDLQDFREDDEFRALLR